MNLNPLIKFDIPYDYIIVFINTKEYCPTLVEVNANQSTFFVIYTHIFENSPTSININLKGTKCQVLIEKRIVKRIKLNCTDILAKGKYTYRSVGDLIFLELNPAPDLSAFDSLTGIKRITNQIRTKTNVF